MKSTYTLEGLTKNTVAIRILTINNGKKIKSRRSFCNSNYDRAELQALLPENLFSKIITVWGKTATVPDIPDPRVAASAENNEEEKKED